MTEAALTVAACVASLRLQLVPRTERHTDCAILDTDKADLNKRHHDGQEAECEGTEGGERVWNKNKNEDLDPGNHTE